MHKIKTILRVTKKIFATDLCDSLTIGSKFSMDPELFTGSVSGIIVPESDPTKTERSDLKKLYFF